MDQRELAEAVGVARTTLSGWERGVSEPPLSCAARLAVVTGVTLDWLAEGLGEYKKTPTASSDEGLDLCAPPDLNREPIDYGFAPIPDTAAEMIAAWAELVATRDR